LGRLRIDAILGTMRVVGHKNSQWSQAPATPDEAWQRGRALDAMLAPQVGSVRSVMRLTHAQRNALDEARMVDTARRLAASWQHG
jgi:hypothetical protein